MGRVVGSECMVVLQVRTLRSRRISCLPWSPRHTLTPLQIINTLLELRALSDTQTLQRIDISRLRYLLVLALVSLALVRSSTAIRGDEDRCREGDVEVEVHFLRG